MSDSHTLQDVLRGRCTQLPLLALLALQSAHADGLRDPTRPPAAPAVATAQARAPDLLLEAILVDGERRVAIVDGKVVAEGEQIGGATITRIAPGSIQYVRAGRTHEAQLRTTRNAAGKRPAAEE